MAIENVFKAVIEFDRERAPRLVEAALAEGVAVSDILEKGLVAAMDEVGRRFTAGEMFVPEMLGAAQAMKDALEVLKPHLGLALVGASETVVIGTVRGDLHDIGKNLVAMMLEGAGFQVVDAGVDVSPEQFVEAVREHGARVVALSALLTSTMPSMRATVETIRESGLDAMTIIGGAPVTARYAEQIGAHGFAADAPGAVELVRRLLSR